MKVTIRFILWKALCVWNMAVTKTDKRGLDPSRKPSTGAARAEDCSQCLKEGRAIGKEWRGKL